MLDLKKLADALEGGLTRVGCRNVKDLLDDGCPGDFEVSGETESF